MIVKEDFLPPTEWLLGRVSSVISGRDGKIRVAEVLTKNGKILRKIVKLCFLPTNNIESKLSPKATELNSPTEIKN